MGKWLNRGHGVQIRKFCASTGDHAECTDRPRPVGRPSLWPLRSPNCKEEERRSKRRREGGGEDEAEEEEGSYFLGGATWTMMGGSGILHAWASERFHMIRARYLGREEG